MDGFMKRREFLSLSGAFALGALSNFSKDAWATKASDGSLVFFESRYPSRAEYPEAPSLKYGLKYIQGPSPFLTIADLGSGQVRRIATPEVRGHSAVRSLTNPSLVAVLPRAGLKGYLVDLEIESGLRPIV